jgi:hypothetical protein
MKVNFGLLNKLAGILGSMVIMLSLTSCFDDDGEPTPVAYVSIFHASPDAPDLDVVVDNQSAFNQPLEYTDYTGYNQFFTGNRELAFHPFNANNVLLDTTYNFQANKAYSVFVAGEVDNLSALIVEDQADEPAEGNALVRLVHLSPDAPAVDFIVGDEDTPLFSDQAFKEITDFTEVAADTYELTITDVGGSEALVSVPDAELDEGDIYTVIVRGFVDPPSGNTNDLSIQIVQH